MIEVADLLKTYPGVVAVDRISFRVEPGEIVGFLGPNGAGKSTTMRILCGFLAPSSGAVRVAGFDVVRQSLEVRRRVGYLPENNPLYGEMRVEEYLSFRAAVKQVSRRERPRRVGAVLERCGLSGVRGAIVAHLSRGYRQRVGLADALVHDPPIVILDEPTQGLDPTQVRQVRDLIRELGRDRTVMLSTHILSEVEKTCGRVLIIHRGRLVEQGSAGEIANRLMKTGRVRLEVRGDGRAVKETLDGLPGVARVLWSARGDLHAFLVEPAAGAGDLRPELFRCGAARGWEVCELAHERLSLEELFALLTEGAPAAAPAAVAAAPGAAAPAPGGPA